MKLWDPFCGSGTILLEALSMYLGLPVRVNKDSETFDLKNIRIINKDAHTNYLEKLWNVHENVWLEQSDIFILGNDINSEAIKSSINNFSKLLEDQNFSETSPQLNLFKENPVLFQHSFLSNRIHVFLTDFENVPKITSIQGLSILTNPPYGYRSRKHISFNNLKGLYLRFRTLLRKNARNLDEIYVLYPMDQKNAGSLIKMPGLAWNLVEKFENGGIEIGLFQLNKDKTLDMKNKDFHEITIINERIQMEVAKIEENKALIAFKKDPEEKDKRKQEKYKEEKNLLIEARKRTKNLKFPRVVTRDKQKLRRILHAKHEDFIQKSRRKKYIEGKKEIIQKIKAQKAQKSHDVRKKKGLDVINSLIDQENAKVSEEVTKNLQLELNKRANKNLKMRNETMKSAIKKPRSSKW